ncbi:MAG: hypothetical protein OHK93_003334 [Ramalina farinacea]|uniref:Uncharacterized protein n=1 Tax=Ramalina farinacea TaxID=258253 RepID=A0AA43U155_9LECA|nr:hypothetical protein [Ramalina farinacea]
MSGPDNGLFEGVQRSWVAERQRAKNRYEKAIGADDDHMVRLANKAYEDLVRADATEPYCEHHTPKRNGIKFLDAAGHSRKNIKELTGVPERTRPDILNSLTHRPGKERPGRRPKIDQDSVKKMIKRRHGRYRNRTRNWDEFAKDVNKIIFAAGLIY